MKEVKIPF